MARPRSGPGETLHHGLLVCNLSGRVLPVATNGEVTAVVVDPKSGQVVGGFAEAQHMPLIMFRGGAGGGRADPAADRDRQLPA
jgi:hypothetical protein